MQGLIFSEKKNKIIRMSSAIILLSALMVNENRQENYFGEIITTFILAIYGN